MNSPILQLLVLAGIAIFLILRLRNVLGTREGFEKPPVTREAPERRANRDQFEVIEGGPDRDIVDHVDPDSEAAKALALMKRSDPSFSVGEFLSGARGAYEMILMAFEKGDLASVKSFISQDVYDAMEAVVIERERQNLTVDANIIGVSDLKLREALFDVNTNEAEITVGFTGELTYVVRDHGGDIVEGDPNTIKRQKDVWTFARDMDAGDPNWQLVATGE